LDHSIQTLNLFQIQFLISTMADRKRQDSMDDADEVFRTDEVSRTVGSESENDRDNGESRGSGRRTGLADRLSEILVEDGDGDLLLQQSDRENNFLQWLQALDLQIMGACRADERLKPLLKVNASTGAAEDRLLAQLSQVRPLHDLFQQLLVLRMTSRMKLGDSDIGGSQ